MAFGSISGGIIGAVSSAQDGENPLIGFGVGTLAGAVAGAAFGIGPMLLDLDPRGIVRVLGNVGDAVGNTARNVMPGARTLMRFPGRGRGAPPYNLFQPPPQNDFIEDDIENLIIFREINVNDGPENNPST